MNEKNKKLLLIGLVVAVIISVIAPFAASENPDGLESAAEEFESAEGKEDTDYESPMPDYIVPQLGEDGNSGAVAVVIGTLVTLIIVLALFYGIGLVKRSSKKAGTEGDEKDTK